MEGARRRVVVNEQRPEGTSDLQVFYLKLLPVKKLPHMNTYILLSYINKAPFLSLYISVNIDTNSDISSLNPNGSY